MNNDFSFRWWLRRTFKGLSCCSRTRLTTLIIHLCLDWKKSPTQRSPCPFWWSMEMTEKSSTVIPTCMSSTYSTQRMISWKSRLRRYRSIFSKWWLCWYSCQISGTSSSSRHTCQVCWYIGVIEADVDYIKVSERDCRWSWAPLVQIVPRHHVSPSSIHLGSGLCHRPIPPLEWPHPAQRSLHWSQDCQGLSRCWQRPHVAAKRLFSLRGQPVWHSPSRHQFGLSSGHQKVLLSSWSLLQGRNLWVELKGRDPHDFIQSGQVGQEVPVGRLEDPAFAKWHDDLRQGGFALPPAHLSQVRTWLMKVMMT